MPAIQLDFVLCIAGIALIRSGVLAGACPDVQAPSGGIITYTGQVSEGTSITAACTNGAFMNGPSMLTCLGGQWNPREFGTCMGGGGLSAVPLAGAHCLPMLAPTGATLNYSAGSSSNGIIGLQSHGTTVTMSCNGNMALSGPSSATCQNGMWIPPILGTCVANGMPTMLSPAGVPELRCHLGLIPPPNGVITYNASVPYPAGTTATLTCQPGYVAKGNTMTTCQNGFFGTLSTCEKAM